MSTHTVKTVPTEKITIQEGHNPREDFDESALAELCESIRTHGLISALTVQENGNGGYLLIAGERRLRAARKIGLGELPVLVRPGKGAEAAAIAENLIREDLNPIEEARAFKALAEAEDLRTHKKIANRVGKSAGYVSERLRLLRLPEPVQHYFAAGQVPVAAEHCLRKVADISPKAAEGLCGLVASQEITVDDLTARTGEALVKLSQLPERRRGFTLISLGFAIPLGELVTDPGRYTDLKDRILAARPYLPRDQEPRVVHDRAEIDAARAAGCLLEVTEAAQSSSDIAYRFLCDRGLAEDLAERSTERLETKIKQDTASQPEDTGQDTPRPQEQDRPSAREQAKAAQQYARAHNLKLGRALIARRGAKTRREFSLGRAKSLAQMVIRSHPDLPAAGLRLVLPQLQKVEIKKLKSGESREKITYAEPEQARAYLTQRIEEARTVEEVLELMADTVIAALYADANELPQSRRRYFHNPQNDPVIASLIKEARKQRLPRPKNRH